VKNLAVLLVSLCFAIESFAQAPLGPAPLQVAQAGGASSGAVVPPATTGAASTIAAVVALGVAGVAAAVGYNTTTPSNH